MSTELVSKVKALITAKGGTASAGEGLHPQDIKQFAEIAQLYFGVLPSISLIGLAYPDAIPANLKEALDAGGSEEGGEGDAPEGTDGDTSGELTGDESTTEGDAESETSEEPVAEDEVPSDDEEVSGETPSDESVDGEESVV